MSKLYEKGDVKWLKAKYYNLFTRHAFISAIQALKSIVFMNEMGQIILFQIIIYSKGRHFGM